MPDIREGHNLFREDKSKNYVNENSMLGRNIRAEAIGNKF